MGMKEQGTHFAPAERSPAGVIAKDAAQFDKEVFFARLMDFLPLFVMILDKNRQLVFANKPLLEMFGPANLSYVLGQRPGEVLHRIHLDRIPSSYLKKLPGTEENGLQPKQCTKQRIIWLGGVGNGDI